MYIYIYIYTHTHTQYVRFLVLRNCNVISNFARFLYWIPGRVLYFLHKITAASSLLFLRSFLVFVASPFVFELRHSPISLSSSFQLQSCCYNYFKVIRALIAGRCFSGGQVPWGQAPSLTQFLPSALFPPSPLPPPTPSFAARGSPVALPHFNTTESLQVLSCSSAGTARPVNSDYWFTVTPLLKTRFGPNGGAPSSPPCTKELQN